MAKKVCFAQRCLHSSHAIFLHAPWLSQVSFLLFYFGHHAISPSSMVDLPIALCPKKFFQTRMNSFFLLLYFEVQEDVSLLCFLLLSQNFLMALAELDASIGCCIQRIVHLREFQNPS